MFGKKFSMTAKGAILIVLIAALLLMAVVALNMHLTQANHSVAWTPNSTKCTLTLSSDVSASCLQVFNPTSASWGS